jgi:hypothetical protein
MSTDRSRDLAVVRAFTTCSIILGTADMVVGAAGSPVLFLVFAGAACTSGLIARWWAHRTVLRPAGAVPEATPRGD